MIAKGKGIYIWNTLQIINQHFGGSIARMVGNLRDAGVSFVAMKIVNAAYVWPGLKDVFAEFEKRNITAGAWGYSYLNGAWGNTAEMEANAVLRAIDLYKPAFYLLDVEGQLRWQFIAAKIFANKIKAADLNIPIGLNSYALPDYQPLRMYPWRAIASCCTFNCPQVYWRTADPITRLQQSRTQYAALLPKLGIPMVAGDMYFERGIRPTPGEVKTFLEFCKQDKEITGALMWSYDQKFTEPALWKAFSEVFWPVTVAPVPIPEPMSNVELAALLAADTVAGNLECAPSMLQINKLLTGYTEPDIEPLKPAWVGVCNVAPTAKLNVRSAPSVNSIVVRQLQQGDRVEVWKEKFNEGRLWLRIRESAQEWVAGQYVKRI